MSQKEKILKYWYYIILIILIISAFWVRSIPARIGEIQALDPFYFYRASETLVQNNLQLPDADLMRHYPFGHQLWDYLLPIYAPAVFYMFLTFLGMNMNFLHFAIIFPAILGALSVLIIFFVGKELRDYKTGLFAAFFLATVPAFITRTSAGFFEKESFLGVFILLSIYLFAVAYRKSSWKWGILSGISLAMAGLSGGMVVYLQLILASFVFIVLIVNKYNNNLLKSFVPTVILGIFIPQIFTEFVHIPWTHPSSMLLFGMMIIVLLRYGVEKFNLIKKEKLPYFMPTIIILAILGILFGSMFIDPLLGFTQGLMSAITIERGYAMWTVAENQPGSWDQVSGTIGTNFAVPLLPQIGSVVPSLGLWVFMFLGLFLILYRFFRKQEWLLWLYLVWIFSSIYAPISMIRLNFLLGMPAALFGGYFFSWLINKARQIDFFQNIKKTDSIFIGFGVLFLILAFAMFSSNMILAVTCLATAIILLMLGYTIKKSEVSSVLEKLYRRIMRFEEKKMNILLIPLVIIIVFTLSIHLSNAYVYSMQLGPSICFSRDKPCITIDNEGNYQFAEGQPWYDAMNFLATETPEDSNILSWWDFGYWFQTRGKRPTVSDGGYGPRDETAQWFTANPNNWSDFDPWLKDTYGVDYILMDYTLPGKYGAISKIATKGERVTGILNFKNSGKYDKDNKTIYEFTSGPYAIWLSLDKNGTVASPPMFLLSQNGQYVSRSYINDLCTKNGIMHLGDNDPHIEGCVALTNAGVFYVPAEAEHTIFTNLMFMEGYGLPLEKVFDNSFIQIYKVIY